VEEKADESIEDVIRTLRRITDKQRTQDVSLEFEQERPPLSKIEQENAQAQHFFKSAVAEVAKSLQSKRGGRRLNKPTGEEMWDDFVCSLNRKESVRALLERLEKEGIIPPPEPFKDPFVAAFETMSYKTPVPLAPLAPHLPPPAAFADARSLNEMPKTETVPGSVAAMLEQGLMMADSGDVGEGDDEQDDANYLSNRDASGFEIVSTQFDSASPTLSSDEVPEDRKNAISNNRQAMGGTVSGEAAAQGNDLVDTMLRQHRTALHADTAAPSRVDAAQGQHEAQMKAAQQLEQFGPRAEAAQASSASPVPAVSGQEVKNAGGRSPLEEQQEEQTGAKDADGERAEEEEDVTYEIRVVYVTDSTIGLRTTWPDG
jgi:hypothetical protein